jgi:hypothetical protein
LTHLFAILFFGCVLSLIFVYGALFWKKQS